METTERSTFGMNLDAYIHNPRTQTLDTCNPVERNPHDDHTTSSIVATIHANLCDHRHAKDTYRSAGPWQDVLDIDEVYTQP